MFEVFIFTNGIFLGILLLLLPSKIKRANLYLALFLFSLSLEILPAFFEEENIIIPDTSFLTVPLLFFYVQQLVVGKIKPPQWLLVLPTLSINAFLFLVVGSGEPSVGTIVLISIPFYAINLVLLFRMHKQIVRHHVEIQNRFASLELHTLKWVKGLVLIFLVFHFVWMIDDALLLSDIDAELLAIIAEILTLFAVFWIGYHGLSQRGTLENQTVTNDEIKARNVPTGEDQRSFEQVKKQLEENKLYLNQELTLRILALQCDVNEKRLSGWINQFTESNFYFFINSYRVDEFKHQVAKPANKNLSLLGIAQNAGFKNKSTFYKVFRELEGITPNDYKKQVFEATKV